MIGELRLKVDGMQKELMAQAKRLEEGTQFKDHFHSDLRAAVQVMTQSDGGKQTQDSGKTRRTALLSMLLLPICI